MPEYRFYRVAQSGHIHEPPVSVEAANDAGAIKLAREKLKAGDIEVWQGTRLVAYLTPDPKGDRVKLAMTGKVAAVQG